MVKNGIKIYARIRDNEYNKTSINYEIAPKEEYEDILFSLPSDPRQIFHKTGGQKFRFHKVFSKASTQADVFDIIAKPVVNSVLNGYNGTIFAYGQTGSGKTYSITGSSHIYDNRGIIPRSIQHVFEYANNNLDNHTIYISYLEIYNENGFDLLNTVESATNLEELPRVTLLEDSKGECHLKNLSILPVQTEQEAMRLLYLGDTNRTIAETPMNEYSSRSHCIFTVYIAIRDDKKKHKIRRAKLHLVDLAGSERLTKSNRTLITEARHINLSLHYLEQVISALSEDNRSHIPFRNSMMTFMLKDSLAGNCLTAMLATLSGDPYNIEETITTCKFAQRVAMVYTEPTINEEIDPQEEIISLKAEISNLKKRIEILSGDHDRGDSTVSDTSYCKNMVENFINNPGSNMEVGSNVFVVQECFKILRQMIVDKNGSNNGKSENITMRKYEELLTEKENHISTLTSLLHDEKVSFEEDNKFGSSCSCEFMGNYYTSFDNESNNSYCIIEELDAFKQFTVNNQCYLQVEQNRVALKEKQKSKTTISNRIKQCQENISKLKARLEQTSNCQNIKELLNQQLIKQQMIYQESLKEHKIAGKEITYLNRGLEQAKIKLQKQFQFWYENVKNRNPNPYADRSHDLTTGSSYHNKNNSHIFETEKFNATENTNKTYNYNDVHGQSFLLQKNLNDKLMSNRPTAANLCDFEKSQEFPNYMYNIHPYKMQNQERGMSRVSTEQRSFQANQMQFCKENVCQAPSKDIRLQRNDFGGDFEARLLQTVDSYEVNGNHPKHISNNHPTNGPDFFLDHPQEYSRNYDCRGRENQYQFSIPMLPNQQAISAQDVKNRNVNVNSSAVPPCRPRAQDLRNAFSENDQRRSCHVYKVSHNRDISVPAPSHSVPSPRATDVFIPRCNLPMQQMQQKSAYISCNEGLMTTTETNGKSMHNRFRQENRSDPQYIHPSKDCSQVYNLNKSLPQECSVGNGEQVLRTNASNCLNDMSVVFTPEKDHNIRRSNVLLPDTINVSAETNPKQKTKEKEFSEFIKTVPMTGDPEVDEEITNFYKSKFNIV